LFAHPPLHSFIARQRQQVFGPPQFDQRLGGALAHQPIHPLIARQH
jgi:hypothetical protein